MFADKDDELVDDLKLEHRNLIKMFRNALFDGIRSEKGIATFRSAFSDLQVHFENEEILIYQPIKISKFANKRSENIMQHREDHQFCFEYMLDMIATFDKNLSNIDVEHLYNVDVNYIKIVDAIAERFEFEEDVLFTMYNHVTNEIN
jgi:hypothetical protein